MSLHLSADTAGFASDSRLLEQACHDLGLQTFRIGASVFVCEGVAFYGSTSPNLGGMMIAHDKHATKQLASAAGVRVAAGDVYTDPATIPRTVPVAVKPVGGTGAKGVTKVTDPARLPAAYRAARAISRRVIVEEWVDGPKYRLLVVGDTVAGVFRSEPKKGGIASAHAGAQRVEAYAETTEAMRQAAVTATKAVGLEVAGVDMILAADGPVLLEVNSVPRIKGHHQPDRGESVDVASLIVAHYLHLP